MRRGRPVTVLTFVAAILTTTACGLVSGPVRPFSSAYPTSVPKCVTPQLMQTLSGFQVGTGIHMVTSKSGWAETSTGVWRTSDGGHHWYSVLLLRAAAVPLVLSTWSSRRAWVALVPNSREGTVYWTTNAGCRWQRTTLLPLPTLVGGFQAISSVQFQSAQAGWLVATGPIATALQPFTVYRTTDGGRHWVATGPGMMAALVTGGSFASPTSGWVGQILGDRRHPGVLHSNDGGRSWVLQRLALPPAWAHFNPNSVFLTYPPLWFSASQGILVAVWDQTQDPELKQAVVYRTEDGGAVWVPGRPIDLAPSEIEPPTSWVSSSDGWMVVGPHTLVHTPNGGRTWIRSRVPESAGAITGVDFLSPQRGWVWSARLNGWALWTTGDGGDRWTEITASNVVHESTN
jgi:photosystem II stability/assembly factor-like uncharacterized protein